MKRGLTYSVTLHALLLIVMVVGLPSLFDRPPEHEPMFMTVEVLPITDRTNIQNKAEKKVEKELPKEKTQKEAPKPAKQEKSEPAEVAKKETKPQEQPKESLKKEVKKEEKKKEEKKEEVAKAEEKPKKDKAKPQEELDALLKDLSKADNNKQADEEVKETAVDEEGKTSKDEDYDPTVEIGMTVRDAIRQQINKNWSVPAGAEGVENMTVVIEFTLDPSANLLKMDVKANASRMDSDPVYRAFVESAMRAIQKSSPLQGLPADKYAGWKKMKITFDPRDALY